jgi:hypothetical protein
VEICPTPVPNVSENEFDPTVTFNTSPLDTPCAMRFVEV